MPPKNAPSHRGSTASKPPKKKSSHISSATGNATYGSSMHDNSTQNSSALRSSTLSSSPYNEPPHGAHSGDSPQNEYPDGNPAELEECQTCNGSVEGYDWLECSCPIHASNTSRWEHRVCTGLSDEEYARNQQDKEKMQYFCRDCHEKMTTLCAYLTMLCPLGRVFHKDTWLDDDARAQGMPTSADLWNSLATVPADFDPLGPTFNAPADPAPWILPDTPAASQVTPAGPSQSSLVEPPVSAPSASTTDATADPAPAALADTSSVSQVAPAGPSKPSLVEPPVSASSVSTLAAPADTSSVSQGAPATASQPPSVDPPVSGPAILANIESAAPAKTPAASQVIPAAATQPPSVNPPDPATAVPSPAAPKAKQSAPRPQTRPHNTYAAGAPKSSPAINQQGWVPPQRPMGASNNHPGGPVNYGMATGNMNVGGAPLPPAPQARPGWSAPQSSMPVGNLNIEGIPGLKMATDNANVGGAPQGPQSHAKAIPEPFPHFVGENLPPQASPAAQEGGKIKRQRGWEQDWVFCTNVMVDWVNKGEEASGARSYKEVKKQLSRVKKVERSEASIKSWWTRYGRKAYAEETGRKIDERRPSANGETRPEVTSQRPTTKRKHEGEEDDEAAESAPQPKKPRPKGGNNGGSGGSTSQTKQSGKDEKEGASGSSASATTNMHKDGGGDGSGAPGSSAANA